MLEHLLGVVWLLPDHTDNQSLIKSSRVSVEQFLVMVLDAYQTSLNHPFRRTIEVSLMGQRLEWPLSLSMLAS